MWLDLKLGLVALTLMGLRKWLLGFDPEEFKARLEV